MAISVTAKTDYSLLFSSINTNASTTSSSLTNLLSDYALIKSGSYSKLMKAYYSMDDEYASGLKDLVDSSNSNNSVTGEDTVATQLSLVKSESDNLKESADSLLEMDFTTSSTEEAYKAASAFVEDYNSVYSNVSDATQSSLNTQGSNLLSIVSSNSDALKNVGIEMNSNGELVIDEEQFKAASTDDLTNLFNGSTSLAYRVSNQASIVNFTASNELANSTIYTTTGGYSSLFTTGTSYDSYF